MQIDRRYGTKVLEIHGLELHGPFSDTQIYAVRTFSKSVFDYLALTLIITQVVRFLSNTVFPGHKKLNISKHNDMPAKLYIGSE